MRVRNLVLVMLFVTVIAPIVLYTDRLTTFKTSPSAEDEFVEDVTSVESSTSLKEPIGIVFSDNLTKSLPISVASAQQRSTDILLSTEVESREHKSTRVLSTTLNENIAEGAITAGHKAEQLSDNAIMIQMKETNTTTEEKDIAEDAITAGHRADQLLDNAFKIMEIKPEQKDQTVVTDARVRQLKDQLIRAKVYLSLPATRNNPHFTRELRGRIKEVHRALGDARTDSELPRNAYDRLRAMEQTLVKGKQIQDDCSATVKKLRAMLHSTEEQLRVHKKQTMFLTQLTAKTLPKGLHCLPLRLTTEYYTLNFSQQEFPNKEKLEDPQLYHYALFSDNVLAAAVVVNSTVIHAKDPSKHVFHIVSDKAQLCSMRMWFLVNPPGNATVQVQNIEEFTWLNSSYSPVLKQLGSPSMIDYYFRAHRANSDSNLKYRNPKYLSILNHLRFYLPEIFPKLNKVLFLDDDVVVQRDLTDLWSLDLKGNVNGAVETCGERFHRFDRYLNFSNPLISTNFDPHACGWAYGMNIFDLEEWKRQNITVVYHTWQKLNFDRQLWKLGTLPPGLITFWKRTYPLAQFWHVLGLGYNPSVNQKDIERAAVIHYNGNMKPWLEISLPKYRNYWTKYIDYDHVYLRDCNINP
ncbi:putative galacturonosyltransferase 4 [Morella rubra]|uniref:Hexosyltransferase n=1 Tax=Morella rubra TaxID=262757 RepID=A0A6A1WD44_9ROSI|nr:putative galacturonosyltransferase 4 [Morella rubra]